MFGVVRVAVNDPALALASLRTAASLEPLNPATSLRLGDFLVRVARIASLDITEERWSTALTILQDASAKAHASGQTAVAADVDGTIEAVRSRVTSAK
jgi:hypothetical protein